MHTFLPTTRTPEEIASLEETVEQGNAIRVMMATEGWQILEAHLKEQLSAYVHSNSVSARDWNNYLEIAGKIRGIQLLLTNVEDFVNQGNSAANDLEELKTDTHQ